MINKIIKRLDFHFKPVTIFPLFIALLAIPAAKILPLEMTYENSMVENFQLIVLFATFLLCLNTKIDKKFYNFLAVLCVIIFLREIDCGRTIFFPVEGQTNAYLPWSEIPFGFIVYPFLWTFFAGTILYFLITKSYRVLFNYFTNAKISVYNWFFALVGLISILLNIKTVFPRIGEMLETLFYVAFAALVFLQTHNDEYIEAVKGGEQE